MSQQLSHTSMLILHVGSICNVFAMSNVFCHLLNVFLSYKVFSNMLKCVFLFCFVLCSGSLRCVSMESLDVLLECVVFCWSVLCFVLMGHCI